MYAARATEKLVHITSPPDIVRTTIKRNKTGEGLVLVEQSATTKPSVNLVAFCVIWLCLVSTLS